MGSILRRRDEALRSGRTVDSSRNGDEIPCPGRQLPGLTSPGPRDRRGSPAPAALSYGSQWHRVPPNGEGTIAFEHRPPGDPQ